MVIKLIDHKPYEAGDIIVCSGEEVFLLVQNDAGFCAIDLEYNTVYFTSKTLEHLVDALITNCGCMVAHHKSKDILLTLKK